MTRVDLTKLSRPYGVHPDRNQNRGPLGRFRATLPLDAQGKPYVILDLRDVERRLKARPKKTEEEE